MKTLFTRSQIQEARYRLATGIRLQYGRDKPFIFLVVMDGAMRFGSDLIQLLGDNAIMESVKAKSYVGFARSNLTIDFDSGKDALGSFAGKDVLIVEDIVDTGRTVHSLITDLAQRGASRVRTCTLLHKPSKSNFIPDHVGFRLEGDPFVVGYGLDLDGKYRNRNSIYDYEGTED